MAEGWKKGLGHHSKIEWDRGWHTSNVTNAEKNAENKKAKLVDTSPGGSKTIEPEITDRDD